MKRRETRDIVALHAFLADAPGCLLHGDVFGDVEPRSAGEKPTMISATTITTPVNAVVQRLKAVFSGPPRDESHPRGDLVSVLCLAHPNVLVVGPAAETDRMFERMRRYLRTPIASWVPRDTPHPPTMPCRTLVIRDVEQLNATQQESLLVQLCRSASDMQVVAISEAPLFQLIKRGLLDRLYYQLHVVVLDVTDDRWAS